MTQADSVESGLIGAQPAPGDRANPRRPYGIDELPALIATVAEGQPWRVALRDDGVVVTYAALAAELAALSEAMDPELGPDDLVTVVVSNALPALLDSGESALAGVLDALLDDARTAAREVLSAPTPVETLVSRFEEQARRTPDAVALEYADATLAHPSPDHHPSSSRYATLAHPSPDHHPSSSRYATLAHPSPDHHPPSSRYATLAHPSPDHHPPSSRYATLTYAEFGARVTVLARQLIALGVGPETLVALAIRRSFDLVVGMYAIIEAGGAYLPIDPGEPADRIAAVLTVAEPAVVLTTTRDEPELGADIPTLRIDRLEDLPAPPAPAVARSADDIAYVMVTSGSTGRPEGVAVSHRSIAANLRWRQRLFRLRPDDVVLQQTPCTVDVSVWEFFWPLSIGARVVIAAPDGHRDPAYLAGVIRESGVTVAHFTPSMLAMFLADQHAAALDSLRMVFTSGEELPAATAAAFRDVSGATLYHLYGPTEAAIDVTAHEVTAEDVVQVPIGVAADDTELLVLDDRLRPVAPGAVGELYLSGVQLARGYITSPGSTAERFVANPEGPAGERMYRTGERVRWSDDGELIYLDRGTVAVSSPDTAQVFASPSETAVGRIPAHRLFDATTVDGVAIAGEHPGAAAPPWFRRAPEPIALSPAQWRLWLLNRIETQDGADSVHNLPIVLRLTGRLDVKALERAVLDVLTRHETLRTVYRETGSGPHPSVMDAADIGLSLRAVPISRSAVDDAVAEIVRSGFDLTTELPSRVALLVVDRGDGSRGVIGDEYVLVFVVHRIAADARSVPALVTDLIKAYLARLTSRRPQWDALPMRYADYLRWHADRLGAGNVPGDLAYRQLRFWRDALDGAPARLPLPTDRPRPAVASQRGAAVDFLIPPEVTAGLRALARRSGATLFITLHAAFAATLARLSGSADIVIGSPVGGRGDRALDALVGLFDNTVALRTRVDLDASFSALLAEVREGDSAAFANADLPFERLVAALPVDRSSGAHPLFQVMFSLDAATPAVGGRALEVPWLSVRPVEIAATGAEFDLHLVVGEQAGSAGLTGSLRYATDLFDVATAESYAARFRRLLVAVAVNPDVRIGDIELLSDAERARILGEWTATAHPVGESGTLASLFAAQAALTPDAPAITFDRTTLSYGAFAGLVNRLARYLIALGVGPESLVGLCIRHPFDLVVGVYAVIEAGGGYLPLEPGRSAEQIIAMAEPVCVLTDGSGADCGAAEIRIDRLDLTGYPDSPLTDADRRAPLRPANTAYVLCTSASTGVVLSHGAIVNRLRWMQSAYAALGPGDVLLQKAPGTDNVSVPEFFWPLQVGARMVLARPGGHRDPAYLARLIRSEGVTVAHFVPSMLAAFVAQGVEVPSLREVFCSGETLPGAVAQRMRALTGAAVHNGYGPTEAAAEVTFHEVSDADFETVPIGRAIWNTRAYVLDARLRPVPVGVPGELYLAGAQLARGYLGRAGRTGDRFVADPFGPAGERMYRTGDLVAWTAAGELEFLGRADVQARIRGLRIDLGEIESALLAVPGIGQAAVLVRDDRGTGEQLVAYLVATEPIEITTVREALAERLPGYLVPEAFVVLDRFPVDVSGKLDRTALPTPAFEPPVSQAPCGLTETLVAQAFTAVLDVPEVGVDDDFFALGGDSFSATRLAARLSETTGAEVALRTIFDAPTVRELARRITVNRPIEVARVAPPRSDGKQAGTGAVASPGEGEPVASAPVETGRVASPLAGSGRVASPKEVESTALSPLGTTPVVSVPTVGEGAALPVGLPGEAEPVASAPVGGAPVVSVPTAGEGVALPGGGEHGVSAPVETGSVVSPSVGSGPVGSPRDPEAVALSPVGSVPAVSLPTESGRVESQSGEAEGAALSPVGAGSVVLPATGTEPVVSPLSETAAVALPPLTPQERSGPTPLSIAQQRMWFLNRFDTASGGYNIPFALRLTGVLNVSALEAAVCDVIARHETLRTLYPEHDGVATQVVLPTGTKLVELVARPVPAAQVSELVGAAARAGFDVTAEVPLRVRLWRVDDEAPTGAQVHILLFVVHHIVADCLSFAPLARDLINAYVARCASMAPAWGSLPVQYADFAIWQRAALGAADDPNSVLSGQLAYWTDRLAGLPEVLTLPSDRPRPAVATNRGGVLTGRLDAELHQRIRDFAAAHGLSPFMVLHAALAVLLSRYGAGADVVIGTQVDGRGAEALDGLVGPFVNTLVLRTEVRQDATLAELLASVRATDLAAFDHAAMPFAQVVEAVNPVRSQAHAPLYQVALTLRNPLTPEFRLHRLAIAAFQVGPAPIHLDLDWALTDRYTADGTPDGIEVHLRYALDLFDAPTVAGFLAAFDRVLRAMVRDVRVLVGNVELMSLAERGMLLSDRNATAHAVPGGTLDDLLTARVAATPDEIGVRYEGSAVTYAQFASRVNRLARALIGLGVGPEIIVGLAAVRSIDMLVAMYAIVRAGGVYLPIDPAHTAEHLARVVASAAPRLVLTAGGAALPGLDDVPVLDLADLDLNGVAERPVSDAERIAVPRPDNTAYVLFTSGSTGLPKGVAVTHRAIRNQLRWLEFRYRVTASDRIAQHAPLTSDVSVWECFLPIAVGAPLVIARPSEHLDLGYVAGLLRDHGITFAEYAPSMLAALIGQGMGDALRSLRHLRCGGAALTPALLSALRGSVSGALHNAYRTSETAISAICHEFTDADIESGRRPAIGRPCWNTRAYVLDARLRPVPIGVTGELYLAGDQLARGYHANPGRTAERFVADPFGVPGRLMFRTGDLVRWNRGGTLEYLGRSDFRMIRGQRMQLGEIETALAAAAGVTNAAVLAVENNEGSAHLVGYVTGTDRTPEAVLAEVRAHLPAAEVLAHLVVLDEMPLTAAGELDRSALPAVEYTGATAGFRAPRGGAEAVLATLVAELVGVARIGADDDFFARGGNSLLAVRLVARANAALGCALTVREVFQAPTVAQLARRIAPLPEPDAPLTPRERPRLDTAERALVLDRWNDTAAPVDPTATLISLFEAQVARTPDAPAVTVERTPILSSPDHYPSTSLHTTLADPSPDHYPSTSRHTTLADPSPDHHPSSSRYTTLTYAEFAARARRLARWLVEAGVGPDAPVALGMRRSLDLVVGIYAVTLAGGAYVPLDPADSTDRLQDVLRTVRPVCVLTSGLDLAAGEARQVRIDRLDLRGYSAEPLTALDRLGAPRPAHLASVIFTSGHPEGMAVPHAAIVNRLTGMQSAYPLSADDVVLHNSPATSAASIWELFWPLVFGAHLVVARPHWDRDPADLARVIIEQRVTTVHFVPPMLGVFLADPRAADCITLRNVFTSGEALPALVAQRVREVIGARVHDLYRPTEAALDVTYPEVTEHDVHPEQMLRPRPARVPLSPAQQRMWFHNRFAPPDTVHNLAAVVRLTGYLDSDTLAAAVGDVVGRHETLRTVYPDLDGTSYQHILDPARVQEIRALDSVDALREFVSGPFDLTAEVPLRVGLVTRSDRDHVLALVTHRIAADSFSMGVLVRDLATAYAAHATRTEPVWAELDVQYADYALWQHRMLGAAHDPDSMAARQLRYWRETLRGLPVQLGLRADRPRPAAASHAAASVTLALPDDLRDAIAAVAAHYEATPFMVLHAALATSLARLSGATDIAIGASIPGRGDAALADLVGPFGNTLVLRAEVLASDTFAAILRRVRENDLEAFAHADVPFERVAEALDPPRSQARQPLFQVALLFGDLAPVAADMAGVAVSEYEFDCRTTTVDLQLAVAGGALCFTYATDLFDASTVEAFATRFVRLLAAVLADPDQVVGDIDRPGADEPRRGDRKNSAYTAS
ncbi:non-ribosomal peptide synthetase [Nocardia pneumoniae]|uniref:non-ribosomal peptide synthetase n=1 Tax=Nocardia pneumoniae TaxID=228601 RepID=UPI0002F88456|nr:non-ribosomal peptide synthetase [Nocardia pneumoniae]